MQEIKLSSDINVITAEINSYKQLAGQSIWEIGRLYNQLVDELKKRFLLEKGIKTVRITNEQVMELAKKERERTKHFEKSFNFLF